MDIHEIKEILISSLALDEVYVSGNSSHIQVIAVSKIFAGMSRVKQQQTIYAPLMKYITNNSIHAISIKAYTIEEWQSYGKNLYRC
ncbi:BolA family protein [Candidatus Palibaumannia cicadellinicola]|uniref:BolA/YrbA family protein n=1 Tax=Baumannia cicadellinicola subsp. Homalodisca coagulata TaxID=374463 RepID=Q1LU58_BAUCH|nr:BolA family protein [Candidatus Baumannia cicadellinicola]ABF14008.1 BolA/YrbA family protein [Baumannia cicadellinicola str. Hc (Homalodisca coagulata)]MBS0032573.1 BolA family transcriptional regulator [Candidatus Baumannia cicadellinicola]MCJ7462015.1 BolA family transcriptional regulator [Candidatus Baumannia cicadellinicola]MCJ7462564.1 BolA family transcriptional regulator [Candidatus Baumannia cicadellinicola]